MFWNGEMPLLRLVTLDFIVFRVAEVGQQPKLRVSFLRRRCSGRHGWNSGRHGWKFWTNDFIFERSRFDEPTFGAEGRRTRTRSPEHRDAKIRTPMGVSGCGALAARGCDRPGPGWLYNLNPQLSTTVVVDITVTPSQSSGRRSTAAHWQALTAAVELHWSR
jgi:hypothetical protein